MHPIDRPYWLIHISSFTFAWFATTMATGGIATLLNAQPNQFPGLKTIGKVVFIYDLVLFVAFTALATLAATTETFFLRLLTSIIDMPIVRNRTVLNQALA